MKSFRDALVSYQGVPYEQARALPGAFYTDPRMLDLETEQLFGKEWLCVGRVEEVPGAGDYMTCSVADEPMIIVRGSDGVIRALSNVCRHRAARIADASGNARRFVCPYHHWSYDTTGALVSAPGIEARADFDPRSCRLPSINCEVWQGFVFVSFDPAATKLAVRLAGLAKTIGNYHLEQMTLRHVAVQTWETNWKCLLENFIEGYHLTSLHRRTLHQLNPTHLCQHLEPGDAYFGYTVGFAGRLAGNRIGHADLSGSEVDTCVMFAVPPGFAVGIGSDYTSFLCLFPQSTGCVRVKMGLIFFGDTWSESQVQEAVTLFDDTMAEDKAVLVGLRHGLASRFHAPGPLAARHLEGTVWDFYQYLCRRLLPSLPA